MARGWIGWVRIDHECKRSIAGLSSPHVVYVKEEAVPGRDTLLFCDGPHCGYGWHAAVSAEALLRAVERGEGHPNLER